AAAAGTPALQRAAHRDYEAGPKRKALYPGPRPPVPRGAGGAGPRPHPGGLRTGPPGGRNPLGGSEALPGGNRVTAETEERSAPRGTGGGNLYHSLICTPSKFVVP